MFGPKIKLDRELYARLQSMAEEEGHSSVDELVVHILEQASSKHGEETDEETARKQLQGLGYLE